MLKVENLIKKYGDLEVLKGIDFQIEKGTIYGFLGKNGAGKTTTMNILTGLIDCNGGNIYYDEKDFKTHKREILKSIGYVPQSPVFYGYMNAYEYLYFIGSLNKMPEGEIRSRALEVLKIVALEDAAKRKVGGYSGGMKQRFGIAVALLNRPRLLFLDEPTSSLDPEGRMEILSLVKELKKQGVTVFLSTHILNDVERVCDEVSILDSGRIIVSDKLISLKNKYVQPIYDIEVEEEPEALMNKLNEVSGVQKVTLKGSVLSVYVESIEKSRQELMKLLTSLNCSLISFNLRRSDLDDIFMRLVNKNENL